MCLDGKYCVCEAVGLVDDWSGGGDLGTSRAKVSETGLRVI